MPRASACTDLSGMERKTLATLPLLASLLLVTAAGADATAAPERRTTKEFVDEPRLSLFESSRPGTCTWLRVDPVRGLRTVVAEFAHDCAGVAVAWSPDASEAIVDFAGDWDVRDGHRHFAFRVDLTGRGAGTPLPLALPAGTGILDQLAFDTDGSPVAIFLEPLDPAGDSRREALSFEGRAYVVPDSPGMPFLAHAFRLERGAWRRIETAGTTSEACDAPGVAVLEAASPDRQAPATFRLLDPAQGHILSTDPIPAELFDVLGRHERNDAEAVYAWVRLASNGRAAVLAVEALYDYAYLTTPVILAGDDGVRELDALPENAILAAASRGRWLLFSEAVSGARPVLYDLDGATVAFTAPGAVTATFWP